MLSVAAVRAMHRRPAGHMESTATSYAPTRYDGLVGMRLRVPGERCQRPVAGRWSNQLVLRDVVGGSRNHSQAAGGSVACAAQQGSWPRFRVAGACAAPGFGLCTFLPTHRNNLNATEN
jgi:hypothetical protein